MESTKPITHYEVLGVERNATAEDIRTAWRRLTLKYHPDRWMGPELENAQAKIREINAAYECLSNPELRQAYDEDRPDEEKLRNDAKDTLLMAINQVIVSTANFIVTPILATAVGQLGQELLQVTSQSVNLKQQIGNIERAGKRIKIKAGKGADLVAGGIAHQLGQLRNLTQELDNRRRTLKAALEMADNYEEISPMAGAPAPAPAEPQQYTGRLKFLTGTGQFPG